jgi:hypothetical protein
MAGRIDDRLKELGIALPKIQMPWANYVSVVARRGGNETARILGILGEPNENSEIRRT